MKEQERRDVKAIVRTYKDADGKDKNVYQVVGTAWVSEHGNAITIVLDTIPVSREWNNKLYVFAQEKKEEADKYADAHNFNKTTLDNVPKDINERVDLSEIPF